MLNVFVALPLLLVPGRNPFLSLSFYCIHSAAVQVAWRPDSVVHACLTNPRMLCMTASATLSVCCTSMLSCHNQTLGTGGEKMLLSHESASKGVCVRSLFKYRAAYRTKCLCTGCCRYRGASGGLPATAALTVGPVCFRVLPACGISFAILGLAELCDFRLLDYGCSAWRRAVMRTASLTDGTPVALQRTQRPAAYDMQSPPAVLERQGLFLCLCDALDTFVVEMKRWTWD